MSFLTEYFDNYRKHPFKKTKPCSPETNYCPLGGDWLKPTIGCEGGDVEMTEEEIEEFIKKAMSNLRGRSTYFNDYCGHLPADMPRPFVPRPKPRKPCPGEEAVEVEKKEDIPLKPLDLKDTELMLTAGALFSKDPDRLVLEPLDTHHRILGYARPRYFACDISEYMDTISRLSYVLVRDGLIRRPVIAKGMKKEYVPGKGTPIVPYDGESLF